MLLCATAHPHEHDVEVNLDQESHLYLHVLDDHHYIKHLRPAASHNDSVVVDMDVALLAVHGLVSNLLCVDCWFIGLLRLGACGLLVSGSAAVRCVWTAG